MLRKGLVCVTALAVASQALQLHAQANLPDEIEQAHIIDQIEAFTDLEELEKFMASLEDQFGSDDEMMLAELGAEAQWGWNSWYKKAKKAAEKAARKLREAVEKAARKLREETEKAARKAAEIAEAAVREAEKLRQAAEEAARKLAEKVAEDARKTMEHTLEIAHRVGASVADISEDVLEDIGEFIKHNESQMGDYLDRECMALQPLFYLRETIGNEVDKALAPLTQRTEAASQALADFTDMDDTKLFDMIIKALLNSVFDTGKIGSKSITAAIDATPAGPILTALKIAFHYSCLKHDDDGYGVWARNEYDDRCIDTQDPCNGSILSDWKFCLFQFPVKFCTDLAALPETCSAEELAGTVISTAEALS